MVVCGDFNVHYDLGDDGNTVRLGVSSVVWV